VVLDLVIRGGTFVDGTGAPARPADVGIVGDQVVEIGTVETDAVTTIDATGKIVAPGFVDVHTHYDAQVFWDGALTPSPLHGVTTVFAGNCGFSVAPLTADPSDGEYLVRMLARVEGMPIEALHSGVAWDWTSSADYFAQVEPRLGVNAGFMVGHSAIRRAVMGADATRRESTPEELAKMQALLREGIEAGGMGFTTSWSRAHNDAEGQMVPSRYATREELVELARIAGEYEGTSLEINPKLGELEPWTVELMTAMSVAAQRPINWNLLVVTARTAAHAGRQLEADDVAAAAGGRIVALTSPVGDGQLRVSFHSGVLFDSMPGWDEVMQLPHDQKVAVFRDADARRRLDEAAQGPDNALRHLAHWRRWTILDVRTPENQQYVGRTIGEIAEAEGGDPWEVLCEIALRDDLYTGLVQLGRPSTAEDWQARTAVWRDRRALVGGSDAGAHLDMMSTAGYTTHMLAAVRNFGLMDVAEAVHLLTQVPAVFYGLRDRGVLREGWKADVVVFDAATVAPAAEVMRYDLPAGAGRLVSDAIGVEHVVVNGTPLVRDGALTDARPGALLRSGQDTMSPRLA
jgi:N-acyl-D-aspartate/D-glutamate deacylase